MGPAGRYALDGQIWRWIYHIVRAILSGDTKAWYYNDIVGCDRVLHIRQKVHKQQFIV